MKKIDKIFVFLLAIAVLISATACNRKSPDKLVIAIPDGAPALVAYSFLDQVKTIGGKKVEVKLFDGPSTVATTFTSGEADVAVLPTNIAAKLFNSNVDIKLASVNLFGVLYLVGNQPIASLNDLSGKIICNIGRGGTPDLTLKLILDENNVEYIDSESAVSGKVALTYVSASSEAITKLGAGKCDYAVIGEPFVTQAIDKISTSIVLDLQDEWSKIIGGGTYMQAGVVLSNEIYSNSVLAQELLSIFEDNTQHIKDNLGNVKSVLTNARSSVQIDFSLETIDRLNMKYVSAVDARINLEKYFNSIINYDSKFIGGKLPGDSFYYNYEKDIS